MENISEIHWHDSEIESVIEIPSKDQLIYTIQYPENWNENLFLSKSIIFSGYCSHTVEEIPFDGNPTILAASIVKEEAGYTTVKIETNAGNRFVTAKSCNLEVQSVSI